MAWRLSSVFIAAAVLAQPSIASDLRVIDANEKVIIPPGYASIEYDPRGYFQCIKMARKGRYIEPYHELVDLDGHPLPNNTDPDTVEPKLPDGCSVLERRDGYLIVHGPYGWAVYSPRGEVLIPFEPEGLEYVGAHRFVIKRTDVKWHEKRLMVDDQGHVILELPEGTKNIAGQFTQGLLNISPDGVYCIDPAGKLVFELDKRYRVLHEFREALAAVDFYDHGENYCCYVDVHGKSVIGPFENTLCMPFWNGTALLSKYESEQVSHGVIDKSGRFVIPFSKYESVTQLSDGTFYVTDKGRKLILNRDGSFQSRVSDAVPVTALGQKLSKNTLVPTKFPTAPSGKDWGYRDVSGKTRIAPKFAYCLDFTGNFSSASVSVDEEQLYGIIDRNANWIIRPKFGSAWVATSNRFIVSTNQIITGKAIFDDTLNTDVRYRLFCKMLRRHNFIGMSSTQLKNIFGKPNESNEPRYEPGEPSIDWTRTIGYSFTPEATCGNAVSEAEFGINKAGKIFGWRVFYHGGIQKPSAWITQNQIAIDETKPVTFDNLKVKANR